MSRFRNEVAHQRAHITTLRIVCLILLAACAALWMGWKTAPSDLTIHVPPDLRSGSTRKWWDIPPESVYTFTFYVFQQLQRWPVNGEIDYPENIIKLRGYLTPSCKAFLEQDAALKKAANELRGRSRFVTEIPGRTYGEDPNLRVQQLSRDDWSVNLDIEAREHYASEPVKRTYVRYPVHVVRMDADPETNRFGMALDCYTTTPQRIQIAEKPESSTSQGIGGQ